MGFIMKRNLHTLMAVALILAASGMIIFWELYLDDNLNTVSVVVAAKNLEKNKVIKDDDIKLSKIKLEQAVERPVRDLREVVGKETSQFVAKGNQFVDEMVDNYGLEPNRDQLIYSIPREWIYSSPGSLRRKDRVYIYAIPDERRKAEVKPDITQVAAGRFVYKGIGSEINGPILKDLVVAYAKDSSNQEVKPAANSDKRIDATGSINNLELVMTQKQYSVLECKYLEGFKFNFAYK
ncbi:MAG: SAF domain-containing protein [Firmicutes bacterium]|nr:SAF domain-containing protein [Bacillota bacterium]